MLNSLAQPVNLISVCSTKQIYNLLKQRSRVQTRQVFPQTVILLFTHTRYSLIKAVDFISDISTTQAFIISPLWTPT